MERRRPGWPGHAVHKRDSRTVGERSHGELPCGTRPPPSQLAKNRLPRLSPPNVSPLPPPSSRPRTLPRPPRPRPRTARGRPACCPLDSLPVCRASADLAVTVIVNAPCCSPSPLQSVRLRKQLTQWPRTCLSGRRRWGMAAPPQQGWQLHVCCTLRPPGTFALGAAQAGSSRANRGQRRVASATCSPSGRSPLTGATLATARS